MIREAIAKDKLEILKFCKNTFSWGDYIEHVWDFWVSEGSLLVCEIQSPVVFVMHFIQKIRFGLKELELILIFVNRKLHLN